MISAWDVDTIYKIPLMLHEQGLDEIVCDKLQPRRAAGRPVDVGRARRRARASRSTRSTIAHGRQVRRPDRIVQVAERSAAPRRHPHAHARCNIDYIDSEDDRARRRRQRSSKWTRSWCRAASASAASKARSRRSATRARTSIPYLGICLGMQVAVIEFARDVAGLADANSTEFDPRHAASGGRADHRVAGPRRHASRSATRSPTSAARCAWARRRCAVEAGHAGARDLRRRS